MKTKLLRKLKQEGRSQINIISVTKTDGIVTGMKIGYDEDEYKGIFNFGNTEEDVYRKAERIYINKYLQQNTH